jgi:signal transduction histidine kinase
MQGVTFMTDIAPELPLTMMDPDQIAAALFHIIKNAFESMPDGGKLLLSAKHSGEQLHLKVTDTGCGIAQYDLDAIYDPFFTSKTRGAGLGLTMVHQIIMNHEGDIRISSEEGKGTSVRILLPIRG